MTRDNRLVLTEQFRPAVGGRVVDVQVEAAPLESLGQLPGVVGGEDDVRRVRYEHTILTALAEAPPSGSKKTCRTAGGRARMDHSP